MTDETREQIKRDSTEYGYKHFNRLDVSSVMAGFIDGATHQHPIAYEQGKKDGRNEAIDDAIKMIQTQSLEEIPNSRQLLYQPGWVIIKQLESLKK